MTLFVDPSRAEQFKCVICLEIYKEPVQIGCEDHIFCKQCVDELISEQGRYFHCPLCRTKCSAKTVTRVKFIDRQINDLKVKCPNTIGTINKKHIGIVGNENDNKHALRRSSRLKEKIGQKRNRSFVDEENNNNINKRRKLNDIDHESELCEWKGSYSDLNNHIKACPLQLISCKYCSDDILQRELKKHYEQCPRFPMKCIQCNKTRICRNNMIFHIDRRCPMTVIKCDECKQEIKRKDEKLHLRKECPEALIQCTFYKFGCMEELKRKDEKNHIENAAHTHNHMVQIANRQLELMDTVDTLKKANQNADKKIKALQNKNKGLNTRIIALENKQVQIVTTVNTVNAQFVAKIAKLPQHYPAYKVVYADAQGNLYRYQNDKHHVDFFLPSVSQRK